MNVDIACCAVAPNVEFNISKSCIKFYEVSLAGCASVVSSTLYGDEVEHGHDGLVCDTVDEWEEALSRLIEDEAYRRNLAEQAKKTVLADHTIEQQWPRWIETLADVLESTQHVPNGLVPAVSV